MTPSRTSSEDARRRADRRARRRDRWAARVIALGGVSVIGCVLLMLVLMASTAVPLFRPSAVTLLAELPAAITDGPLLVAGAADDASCVYTVDDAGTFRMYRPEQTNTETRLLRAVPSGVRVVAVDSYGTRAHTFFWSDGGATLLRVRFRSDHATEGRPTLWSLAQDDLPPPTNPPVALSGQFVRTTDEGFVRVAVSSNATLHVWRYDEDAELTSDAQFPTASPRAVTATALDERGHNVYAGTTQGLLLHWALEARTPVAAIYPVLSSDLPISALGVLLGDQALAIGDGQGGLGIWAPVALYGRDGGKHFARLHDLGRMPNPPQTFAITRHDRSFVARGTDGRAALFHSTTARRLAEVPGPADGMAFTPRGDLLVSFRSGGGVQLLRVRNPHPESTVRAFFARIFYEGYDRPEFVWQSSAANDDFEPKLSLVPLLFGSIKATTYALLFAVPLALLGALYTSQFTTPGLRAAIKPLVELMSAVPSVVIGILAALWLAPRIESALVGTMLLALTVPATTVLFATLWRPVSALRWGRIIERGWEFVVAIPVLLAGLAVAFWLGPIVERALFGGDFAQWCFSQTGVRVDQRNSLVVAFALGFAVIPTVFTMCEDALSNVPRSLTAASLALGASRWQTVRRVVLPSASPGLCAAIIVGFGRAVGETMIVLMATGNTPVMSWGPFSGMRTLSANIAVEIPEAPIGGTLYRTLFFSAVLLFLLTSVLNTAAELVRQRLRKRYGY